MPKFQISWNESARADVRRLDRATAMRIFAGLQTWANSGQGDVLSLQGRLAGYSRLRVGDYRVIFKATGDTMRVFGVKHRSEAYR